MKLQRHTSHENDEIRTNKWPQFVADDVEHDDIYMYTLQKQLMTKKQKKMPDQACANGLHDIPQDLQNIFPLERRLFLHKSHS